MAISAATLAALKQRWNTEYLAQLTRREDYDPDDVTNSTIDEDVLERALIQSREYVAQRKGHAYADSDQPGVIECVPFYLYPDGGAPESVVRAKDRALDDLVTPAITSNVVTTTTRPSYDGDTFYNQRDITNGARARRSWF